MYVILTERVVLWFLLTGVDIVGGLFVNNDNNKTGSLEGPFSG